MKNVSLLEFLFFIKQLFSNIILHWKLALFAAIGVLIIGFTAFHLQTPAYQASVTFIKQNPVLKIKSLMGGTGKAVTVSSIFGDDYISELIKSKDFIETALQQPAPWLGNKQFLDGFWSGDWKSAAGLQKQLRSVADSAKYNQALRITAAKIIKENIASLREDKQLDYFKITIVHPNETFAYEFCTLLGAYAIELHNQMFMAKVHANQQLLQSKSDSIRRSLYASMYQVAQRTDLQINALREIVKTGVAKKEIEANINISLYKDLKKQLELAQLNTQLSEPVIKIIERPWLPLQKEQPWYNRLWSLGVLLIVSANVFACLHLWDKKVVNE